MDSHFYSEISDLSTVRQLPFLVVLPGMDGTCKLLDNFHSEIGKTCRVLPISYPTDRVMDYAELTAYVTARLPQTPFIILGESFSGPIAIDVAVSQANCQGLVLVSTFAKAPAPRFLLPFTRLFHPKLPLKYFTSLVLMSGQGSVAEQNALQQTIASVPARILQKRLSFVLKVNKINMLRRVKVPVLCLAGRFDRLVGLRHARRIAATAPHCTLHEMAAPHMLLETHAAEASALIHKFAVSCATASSNL